MLIYCEKRDVLYELLSGGRALSSELGLTAAAAIFDPGDAGEHERCSRYGARRLYVGRSPHLADCEVERTAEALHQIAAGNGVQVVLIGSTRRGKELAGRLAQKLAAGCVTEAIGLAVRDGKLVAQRYALGGNTVATEVLRSRVNVVAVKPKVFEAVEANQRDGEIVPVDLDLAPPRVTVVERRPKAGEKVNLEQAEVVVAIGRGLQKKEDLTLVQALADVLRGELGCSRSLSSDYGWLSEQRMIGISGKQCSPRLQISVGLSGQIQHTVGILGSKIIVAINKDRSAPIFQIADYGIVGDLYEVLPSLVQRLKKRTGD
jgi:electron transfer flavoprotein alpha subunit